MTKIRWRPFSIWYGVQGDELLVNIAGRSEDGKRVKATVMGTRPYFYVPAGEGQVNDVVTEVDPSCMKSLAGPWGPSEFVDKCYVKYPFDVPRVRDNYSKHYEADVVYERRVRYDLGIMDCVESEDGAIWADTIEPSPGPTIEPRVVIYDIETDDSLDTKDTPEPVLAVSLWDSKTDSSVALYAGPLKDRAQVEQWLKEKNLKGKLVVLPSERELFQAFTKFLNTIKPDVLTNWNYIEFDQAYMKNRAKKKGYTAPNWKEFEALDCMVVYSYLTRYKSGRISLEEAAKECGIEGKTTKRSVSEMYHSGDHEEMCVYNINDIIMVRDIERKKKLVGFFCKLAALSGCGISDAFNDGDISLGRFAESFAFHRAKDKWVLPSKWKSEDGEKKPPWWYEVIGGVALPPVSGHHENLIEADNSQEYVETVRSLNISPETKVVDDYDGPCFQVPSGRRYRKSPRGFLAGMVDELRNLRLETKASGDKDQDAAVKSLMNTLAYGTNASPHNRLGDPDVGNDITDVPRHHLMWNAEFIKNEGHHVKCGFTDAVYYTPATEDHDPEEMVNRLNESLDDFAAQFGCEPGQHSFEVKLELPKEIGYRYKSGIIRAREGNTRGSYAFVYEDPKKGEHEWEGVKYAMKIRGFEERKSNVAPITKQLQKEVLFRAAMGADVEDYLRKAVAEVRAGRVDPRHVRLPQRIHKNFDDFKSKGTHVRAAEWSNRELGKQYGKNSKVCVHYGWVERKTKTDVFAVDSDDPLPEGSVIDWEKTLDRVVIMPLQSVLDILGIHKQTILANVAKAEEFF